MAYTKWLKSNNSIHLFTFNCLHSTAPFAWSRLTTPFSYSRSAANTEQLYLPAQDQLLTLNYSRSEACIQQLTFTWLHWKSHIQLPPNYSSNPLAFIQRPTFKSSHSTANNQQFEFTCLHATTHIQQLTITSPYSTAHIQLPILSNYSYRKAHVHLFTFNS